MRTRRRQAHDGRDSEAGVSLATAAATSADGAAAGSVLPEPRTLFFVTLAPRRAVVVALGGGAVS